MIDAENSRGLFRVTSTNVWCYPTNMTAKLFVLYNADSNIGFTIRNNRETLTTTQLPSRRWINMFRLLFMVRI